MEHFGIANVLGNAFVPSTCYYFALSPGLTITKFVQPILTEVQRLILLANAVIQQNTQRVDVGMLPGIQRHTISWRKTLEPKLQFSVKEAVVERLGHQVDQHQHQDSPSGSRGKGPRLAGPPRFTFGYGSPLTGSNVAHWPGEGSLCADTTYVVTVGRIGDAFVAVEFAT